MILDIHVHISALTPGHGSMSQRLLKSLAFRFMRWRLGIPLDATTDDRLATKLAETIRDAKPLDATVVLAFDAVHTPDGRLDEQNTHLYVTNNYVIDLCRRFPKEMRFGCSIHPYRQDAVAEVERCAAAGAILLKWLPLTQDFDPADERCFPLYDALAHHKLPLLCHTGYENALPTINPNVADPMLLLPALQRGVTVIAAHCGTRAKPGQRDFVPEFMRLCHEHEHFYGDTSALNLPTRSYAYPKILNDPVVRSKLLHGSDWPILTIPPATHIGLGRALSLWFEPNWMKRDILCKQSLSFDDAYWHRAAKVLGVV